MYSTFPGLVLGFHGCDKSIGEKILAGKLPLTQSQNTYDWLGAGSYFWEGNPERAMDYAIKLKNNPRKNKPKVSEPFVIGAVLSLGYCFNLLEMRNLFSLKKAYEIIRQTFENDGTPLPTNKSIKSEKELLIRELDNAVIEFAIAYHFKDTNKIFDSVRGVFFEGEELYQNAGFHEKNHIQISIRNPNCIKGYFRVQELNPKYPVR